jgi:hypothetical protein
MKVLVGRVSASLLGCDFQAAWSGVAEIFRVASLRDVSLVQELTNAEEKRLRKCILMTC